MRERPILFSGPMVNAILRDIDPKTMTRRVMNPQPKFVPEWGTANGRSGAWIYGGNTKDRWSVEFDANHQARACTSEAYGWGAGAGSRYGVAGDRLWVRETWYDDFGRPAPLTPSERGELVIHSDGSVQGIEYRASHDCCSWEAGCPCNPEGDNKRSEWRPSIFMPRWASRITLEVTSLKVERLNDISEEDARAEGIAEVKPGTFDGGGPAMGPNARQAFMRLWESINGKRPGCSWDANPWAWCVSFRRIETASKGAAAE